jgi:hypothetical protein
MTLQEDIKDWLDNPNARGSESHAASLIGQVTALLNEEISPEIESALGNLTFRDALREVMRDFREVNLNRTGANLEMVRDVLSLAERFADQKWTGSIAVIAQFLTRHSPRLPDQEELDLPTFYLEPD